MWSKPIAPELSANIGRKPRIACMLSFSAKSFETMLCSNYFVVLCRLKLLVRRAADDKYGKIFCLADVGKLDY